MGWPLRLLLTVVLVLVFGTGGVLAAGPLETGDNWSQWSKETRTAYVSGYLWGLARGFRDGCEAGQKTYSIGKSRGLPGEKCILKHPNYSRNLEDYVDGITNYYGVYPADDYVPIFKVLEGLSDARKLTVAQMHEYYSSNTRKPQ